MSNRRMSVAVAVLSGPALAWAPACGNRTFENRDARPSSSGSGSGSGSDPIGNDPRGSLCSGSGMSDGSGSDGGRCAGSTLIVNSNLDPPGYDGPRCTLRMAVAAAHNATNACGHGTGQGDTIQLGGPNATFVMLDSSMGPLVIASSMNIQGNFEGKHPNFDDAAISGDSGGGRLLSVPKAATLNLSYVRLTQSNDIHANGAALALEAAGSIANLDTVQLDHCTSWSGGAIYALGALTVTRSSFHDNHAAYGGALSVIGLPLATVSSTTFFNNFADQSPGAGHGGAIDVAKGSSVLVSMSSISSNTAYLGGGMSTAGHTVLDSSTFDGNVGTGNGGGLYDAHSDGLIVHNCTFSGNSTSLPGSAGGGIHYDGFGYFEVSENTVASNHAGGNGGGIWVGPADGTVVFGDNIVANNTAGQSGPDVYGDVTYYVGTTLIGDRTGILNMPPTWIVADPMLGAYASVNGRPKLYTILPGSPAIDGSPDPSTSTIDQRGFPRPIDGRFTGGGARYDLGSFEFDPPRETERLSTTASATVTVITDSAFSQGEGTWLHAGSANDYVTFAVPVLADGTYAISVRAQVSSDCGKIQLATAIPPAAFANLGSVQDLFSSAASLVTQNVGTVTLSGGSAPYFRFAVTGKNVASAGFNVRLDSITLTEL